jgi:hypothetical protein|mmetsp:Transcript_40096/g.63644  ORF Transcript_40096/g.63644 Transcript_40096/m.63644 type:complete len:282 (+) Transcript_40096:40-885(+)|eukprot:CAMPEP_0169072906 /NCGR_PEP_ID=MMETSP1015-20121227/6454_1 /TAXON_ID=342587 /ORGANISM="Karlodinium micrum, Strain CCMP2283" /LENGTH=281 /DNA_ID=CAMNT_0009132113 /DNA_START=38 /DNA_END=883 /DNA_ORIENTATION=+
MVRFYLALAWLACAGDANRVKTGHRNEANKEDHARDAVAEESLRSVLLTLVPKLAPRFLGDRSGQMHARNSRRIGVVRMGKRQGSRAPPQSFNKGRLQKGQAAFEYMKKKDMAREEWINIGKESELGDETGSSLAIEAGITPRGAPLIWAVLRGDSPAERGDIDDTPLQKSVFIMQGNCQACLFPMTNAKVEKQPDGKYWFRCGLCATAYSQAGDVVDWMPARNPIEWGQKMLRKDKEQEKLTMLPTRLRDGDIELRLPDGTLTELPKNPLPPPQAPPPVR